MINIKAYPADEGDAFLISLGQQGETHILIDMGLSATYKNFIRNDLIELKKAGKKIDLLVITHVDQDHIQGAIAFFEENGPDQKIIEVGEVWHNSYKHLQFDKKKSSISESERRELCNIMLRNQTSNFSGLRDVSVKQGSTLARLLLTNKVNWNTSFGQAAICVENCFKNSLRNTEISLLSPNITKLNVLSKTWLNHLNSKQNNFNIDDDEVFDDAFELYMQYLKDAGTTTTDISYSKGAFDIARLAAIEGKDPSKTNGSSISFVLEYAKKKLLFLADSHEDIIFDQLTQLGETGYQLDFDLVKVSHHGSNNNISNRLLNLITSKRYLISTNGLKHDHPNLEAIAKIVMAGHEKELLTNYDIEKLNIFDDTVLKDTYKYQIMKINRLTII